MCLPLLMGPVTVNPSSERSGARARLEAAALEAFARSGFHGTTTRDIAAAAGMSPAALYVHHQSKEFMLYVLSKAGHERALELVSDAAASQSEPGDQLVAVMRAFVLHHARDPIGARVLNYELHALSPEHLAEIVRMRQETERIARDIVERGLQAGEFTTADPRMTAVALLSLGIDVSRWYHEVGDWTPEDVAEHYCELAERMVGARRSGCGRTSSMGS
jgi:AcrR family transcriptional regulator